MGRRGGSCGECWRGTVWIRAGGFQCVCLFLYCLFVLLLLLGFCFFCDGINCMHE